MKIIIAKDAGYCFGVRDAVNMAYDVAKKDGAILTKIKALLMPKPLDEMRDPRDKFSSVDTAIAASGVKISTPDLDGVLGGSPLIGLQHSTYQAIKTEIESEISSIFIETDSIGVVVKSDTLGTLEAIVDILQENNIPFV